MKTELASKLLDSGGRVVATTRSKRGGRLDCGHWAHPHDLIHKLDSGRRGEGQTRYKNGPGLWVCHACSGL